MRATQPGRIAALSVRNPRRTLVAAGVLFVLGVVLGAPVVAR